VPIHERFRRKWALASVSNSVRHRRIRKIKKIPARAGRGGPPEADRTSDPADLSASG